MDTELLVIGAGPYALSAAALAREKGIRTTVLGRPMAFWREHMPEGMFLRSGPDWHLDAAGVHTLEAYLEERGIEPAEVDPIPIDVFLDYADWFRAAKGVPAARRPRHPARQAQRRLRGGADERRTHRRQGGRMRSRHPPLRESPRLGCRRPSRPRRTHLRPRQLRLRRRRARADRRRPPERLRVGGADGRARRRPRRRRPPPRRAALRARELAFHRPSRRADDRGPGLLAPAAGGRAGAHHAPLLGGGPPDARGLADAPPGQGGDPPPPRLRGRRRDAPALGPRARRSALRLGLDRGRPDRLRVGLSRPARARPLPRAAGRRDRAGGRRSRPRRGAPDQPPRPLRHRLPRDQRLRALLRVRQGAARPPRP